MVSARVLKTSASLEPLGIVGRLLFFDYLRDGSSFLLQDGEEEVTVLRRGYPLACPQDKTLEWTLQVDIPDDNLEDRTIE